MDMETDGTPNILLEALADLPPAPDTLATIWEKMGDETLAPEADRLKERFLDLGSRIVLLNNIRSRRSESTLFD